MSNSTTPRTKHVIVKNSTIYHPSSQSSHIERKPVYYRNLCCESPSSAQMNDNIPSSLPSFDSNPSISSGQTGVGIGPSTPARLPLTCTCEPSNSHNYPMLLSTPHHSAELQPNQHHSLRSGLPSISKRLTYDDEIFDNNSNTLNSSPIDVLDNPNSTPKLNSKNLSLAGSYNRDILLTNSRSSTHSCDSLNNINQYPSTPSHCVPPIRYPQHTPKRNSTPLMSQEQEFARTISPICSHHKTVGTGGVETDIALLSNNREGDDKNRHANPKSSLNSHMQSLASGFQHHHRIHHDCGCIENITHSKDTCNGKSSCNLHMDQDKPQMTTDKTPGTIPETIQRKTGPTRIKTIETIAITERNVSQTNSKDRLTLTRAPLSSAPHGLQPLTHSKPLFSSTTPKLYAPKSSQPKKEQEEDKDKQYEQDGQCKMEESNETTTQTAGRDFTQNVQSQIKPDIDDDNACKPEDRKHRPDTSHHVLKPHIKHEPRNQNPPTDASDKEMVTGKANLASSRLAVQTRNSLQKAEQNRPIEPPIPVHTPSLNNKGSAPVAAAPVAAAVRSGGATKTSRRRSRGRPRKKRISVSPITDEYILSLSNPHIQQFCDRPLRRPRTPRVVPPTPSTGSTDLIASNGKAAASNGQPQNGERGSNRDTSLNTPPVELRRSSRNRAPVRTTAQDMPEGELVPTSRNITSVSGPQLDRAESRSGKRRHPTHPGPHPVTHDHPSAYPHTTTAQNNTLHQSNPRNMSSPMPIARADMQTAAERISPDQDQSGVYSNHMDPHNTQLKTALTTMELGHTASAGLHPSAVQPTKSDETNNMPLNHFHRDIGPGNPSDDRFVRGPPPLSTPSSHTSVAQQQANSINNAGDDSGAAFLTKRHKANNTPQAGSADDQDELSLQDLTLLASTVVGEPPQNFPGSNHPKADALALYDQHGQAIQHPHRLAARTPQPSSVTPSSRSSLASFGPKVTQSSSPSPLSSSSAFTSPLVDAKYHARPQTGVTLTESTGRQIPSTNPTHGQFIGQPLTTQQLTTAIPNALQIHGRQGQSNPGVIPPPSSSTAAFQPVTSLPRLAVPMQPASAHSLLRPPVGSMGLDEALQGRPGDPAVPIQPSTMLSIPSLATHKSLSTTYNNNQSSGTGLPQSLATGTGSWQLSLKSTSYPPPIYNPNRGLNSNGAGSWVDACGSVLASIQQSSEHPSLSYPSLPGRIDISSSSTSTNIQGVQTQPAPLLSSMRSPLPASSTTGLNSYDIPSGRTLNTSANAAAVAAFLAPHSHLQKQQQPQFQQLSSSLGLGMPKARQFGNSAHPPTNMHPVTNGSMLTMKPQVTLPPLPAIPPHQLNQHRLHPSSNQQMPPSTVTPHRQTAGGVLPVPALTLGPAETIAPPLQSRQFHPTHSRPHQQ